MAGPVYSTDSPEQFREIELDGLTALFHRRSGRTHILAAPAPQILEALREAPADLAGLIERMKSRFVFDEGSGLEDALRARLDELESAGLVSRR